MASAIIMFDLNIFVSQLVENLSRIIFNVLTFFQVFVADENIKNLSNQISFNCFLGRTLRMGLMGNC